MAEELPLIQLKNNGEIDRSIKSNERKMTSADKEKARNKKVTASQKSGKGTGPLEFLKFTNEWLEDMPVRIIMAYENFIGNGENMAQSSIDTICAWLAWKVNIAVERKRQTVIRILHEQYETTAAGKVMKIATAIQNFVRDPLGALGGFASALFSPIFAVFKFITELVSEILKLAENLAKIVAVLPPNPPNPHINYDKFKLKINSISLADVASGPENLTPPEVAFPEPKKPFSKETFEVSFDMDNLKLKSTKIVYTLSKDDQKTLEDMNRRNVEELIEIPKDYSSGMFA